MFPQRLLLSALPIALALVPAATAQRIRTLGPSGNVTPVTAHRQVAWSTGFNPGTATVQFWNGSTVTPIPTGGNSIDGVGFTAPTSLFYLVRGGTSFGYNAWNGGPIFRVLTNPIDRFYANGNGAVFPTGSYADIGLYTSGASFAVIGGGDALLDYGPHCSGRYVVWHKRISTLPDFQVRRFDRTTGVTTTISTNTTYSQFPQVDEEGRVAWWAGGQASGATTQLRVGDTFRTLAGPTLGAGTYALHHGQLAYLRRNVNLVSWDLVLEDGASVRTLTPPDGILGQSHSVWLRNGMVAWLEAGDLRVFDGSQTITILSTPSVSGFGEFLDRGWIVYNSGGSVTLRESPLTWEQDELDASAGGTVSFGLHGGAANAGRPYLLLASISGTSPGVPLGAVTLPLNPDAFFFASLSLANTPLLSGTLGSLDGAGEASASFNAPPGLLSGIAGAYVSFAYGLYAPALDYVSNPARVKIVP
jgi:hypothetical protein